MVDILSKICYNLRTPGVALGKERLAAVVVTLYPNPSKKDRHEGQTM